MPTLPSTPLDGAAPSTPQARTARRAALVAAGFAILLFSNALSNGFAYDDVTVIEHHRALHQLETLPGALTRPYWPGTHADVVGMWRPVTTAFFGLQWIAFGGDARLFHALNVLLHGVVTGLVILLLAELVPTGAALAAGLLFAAHPVHVEAVSNVVGGAEVLSTLFVLLACLIHVRGEPVDEPRRILATATLFALGLLTKESAIVLPALLVLLDAARRNINVRHAGTYLARRRLLYATLFAVAITIVALRVQVLGAVVSPQEPFVGRLDGASRIHTLAGLWTHYVRLLVVPRELAADYAGVVPVVSHWSAAALVGVTLVLLLLAAFLAWRQGDPLEPDRLSIRSLGFAVVWFGVCVLPTSHVFFAAPVILAERNLYLPSLAACVASGCFWEWLRRRRQALAIPILAVALGGLALRTWTRTPVWADTESVFAALAEDRPEATKSWLHVADQLAATGRMREARRALAVYLRLADSGYAASTDVASRLMGSGAEHNRAAEFLLERAWRERPAYYTAPGYLAILRLNAGRLEEAELPARAAAEMAPDNADVQHVAALVLSGLGRGVR